MKNQVPDAVMTLGIFTLCSGDPTFAAFKLKSFHKTKDKSFMILR
jgi:hypothetical protein